MTKEERGKKAQELLALCPDKPPKKVLADPATRRNQKSLKRNMAKKRNDEAVSARATASCWPTLVNCLPY
jgi:hypothetical protein